MEFLWTLAAAIAAGMLARLLFRRVTVYEFERGLKYAGGRFERILGPGAYWHMPYFTSIKKIDARRRFVSIPGQEVLSADGVSIKVSMAACYTVADPAAAAHNSVNYQEALYLELQLALRAIAGGAEIETLLKERDAMSKQLMDGTAGKARELGLELISVSLKDIMFPGKLRETFAQVVNARQEGLAALERARGETAALRNLANAAKMLEGNPNLLQLRLVQALGEASGNTLVLGMPPGTASFLSPGKEKKGGET